MITVLSIARPLLEALSKRPFSGRVFGLFERACNLVDAEGWVITLALPAIGNGPFSILIDAPANFFDSFCLNQPAWADQRSLRLGYSRVGWSEAGVWEPRLVRLADPTRLPVAFIAILEPYTDWPRGEGNLPVAGATRKLARDAADRLSQAIADVGNEQRLEKIKKGVAQLAGLGNGLTPAGDDFLLGAMAALWLTGQGDILPEVSAVAGAKTTALSAAFLRAAAGGEFTEPWHRLAQAMLTGETVAFERAVRQISVVGASSGLDALAGFATTILRIIPTS